MRWSLHFPMKDIGSAELVGYPKQCVRARLPEFLIWLLMLGVGILIEALVMVHQSALIYLIDLVTTLGALTAVQEPLKDLFANLKLRLGKDFPLSD